MEMKDLIKDMSEPLKVPDTPLLNGVASFDEDGAREVILYMPVADPDKPNDYTEYPYGNS